MPMTVNECAELLKAVHPDLYPIWYIEYKGQYLFNMLLRGLSKEASPCNFYVVDPKNGNVSSSIPVMSIMSNPKLEKLLKNPHELSEKTPKSVEHGVVKNGAGWSVRRKNKYTVAYFSRQNELKSEVSDCLIHESYLMHYGISGMRWGIRRFQNTDGTYTAAGKERYGTGKVKTVGAAEDTQERKLSHSEKQDIAKAKAADNFYNGMYITTDKSIDREKTKKNDSYKTVLTDVAFTILNPINIAFLAADGTMHGIASVKEKKYFKKREKNSIKDPETGLYKKTEGEYTEEQDLSAVNPRFLDMNKNSKNNCMLCTTTYEMRKRGYDVTAQTDQRGYSFGDLRRWFPKAKFNTIDRKTSNGRGITDKEYREKTMSQLLKQPEGSRGNFMVAWLMGGAHSMYYEIKGGQLIIKDAQANKVYTNDRSLMSAYNIDSLLRQTYAAAYVRLDNADFDLEKIKAECVR